MYCLEEIDAELTRNLLVSMEMWVLISVGGFHRIHDCQTHVVG